MQVFVEGAGPIQEIRVAFEDHGYTEWGEALFEERAFFTLRCLFEDKSDDELTRIITEARSEMRETAESEGNIPLVCGDYELYQFFSGGVFFLCIRSSETGT